MIANRIDKIIKSKLCACKNELNNSNLHKAINMNSTPIKATIRSRVFSDVFFSTIKDLMLIIIISKISRIKDIIIALVIKVIIKTKTLNLIIKVNTIKINIIKIKIDFQTPTHCYRQRANCKLSSTLIQRSQSAIHQAN